ncbi:hypothetical protein [Methylobacterium isbiliense]|uniref:hypothetical protein n=1 Tax=Methylobacterium isbiliense TaxID=315478 RepID=UPI001EE1957F|nr:hypothetical protein [Methylobacterium isbiliense]MDN3627556.1 hypothetical protein [Methylobacterium isbiliense]
MVENRKPLKQRIDLLRGAKHPSVRLYVEQYDRKQALSEQRTAQAAVEKRRAKRAAENALPSAKVDIEAEKRLKRLTAATRMVRGDSVLAQLYGRESEITLFWKAMQLAQLDLGRHPTDAEVGLLFAQLQGQPGTCNKHQARSRRLVVAKLETRPAVWGSFVAA